MRPVRLQLSRKAGFNLQALSLATNGLPAVNVARPSKWGNPFKVGDPIINHVTGRRKGKMSQADVVEKFRRRECTPFRSAEIARELRGRNLACWCAPGSPCHSDLLLVLSNGPTCEAVETVGRSALDLEGRGDGG